MSLKNYFLINRNLSSGDIVVVSGPEPLPTVFLNTSSFNDLETSSPDLLKNLEWLGQPQLGFWEAIAQSEPPKSYHTKNVPSYAIDLNKNVVNVSYTVVNLTPEELQIRRKQVKSHYSIQRNAFLQITDFTQLSDAPISEEAKQQFSVFRQQLRTMFEIEDYSNLQWPDRPTLAPNIYLPPFQPIQPYP
jgi:hypothetical protein